MKEDIIAFKNDTDEKLPFELEMVGYSYCDGTYSIKRNNSKVYVFEYVIEGKGTIVTESKEFIAKKGDVYFLEKGSKHWYYSDDKNPWVKIWFNCRGRLPEQLIEIYHLKNLNLIPNCNIYDMFHEMVSLANRKDIDQTDIYNKAAVLFLEIIIKLSCKLNKFDSDALKLKQYINANFESDITVKELSDYMHLSLSQTNRIFKKAFDITPYEYILCKRIENAKLLLINTSMPIKEIANKLKFVDGYYFSKYFKQKTGISPRNYRKAKKYI